MAVVAILWERGRMGFGRFDGLNNRASFAVNSLGGRFIITDVGIAVETRQFRFAQVQRDDTLVESAIRILAFARCFFVARESLVTRWAFNLFNLHRCTVEARIGNGPAIRRAGQYARFRRWARGRPFQP